MSYNDILRIKNLGRREILGLETREKLAKQAGARLYFDARKAALTGFGKNSPATNVLRDLVGANNAALNNFAYTSSSGWVVQWVSKLIRGNQNMLPYNPLTWQEWSKPIGNGANVINGALELVADGVSYKNMILPTSVKANTKYGLLNEVEYNDLDKQFRVMRVNEYNTAQALALPVGFAGVHKAIFTTGATIAANNFYGFVDISTAPGRKIRLKNYRMIELKPGSQEETDFNTLTADQLALKYPMPAGQYLPILRTDGGDDFLSILNSTGIDVTSAPLAIFATIRFKTLLKDHFLLCKNLDSLATAQYLFYRATTGVMRFLNNGANKGSSVAVDDNVFVDVGFIWDGTTVKYYVNLAQGGTNGALTGSLISQPNVRVGCMSTSANGSTHSTFGQFDLANECLYAGPLATEANILKHRREVAKDYLGL